MWLAVRRWWAIKRAAWAFHSDTQVGLLRALLERPYVVTLTLRDGKTVIIADVLSLRVDPASRQS